MTKPSHTLKEFYPILPSKYSMSPYFADTPPKRQIKKLNHSLTLKHVKAAHQIQRYHQITKQ